ncbi:hypothetical protein [Natrononativus amylolyticus]|uniref:hypothetical protein n=1 Tax=Natrononativus amylolyticus TaxID=2963434 RepID=UPI0020CEB9D2|nr:hypothetical protein [Natrononativus amylolyticus]
METAVLLAGGLGAALACAFVLRRVRRRRGGAAHAGSTAALERRANARLRAALSPGVGTHLETRPTVEVPVVADEDGRSWYVPVVSVDLETTDAPGPELVFEFVAPVLEAIAPVFAGERVHHYDVRFTFGPDGLLVSRSCRRVAVTPELAARLGEPSYRAFDLRRDVDRGGDGEGRPPVLWGECVAPERAVRSTE